MVAPVVLLASCFFSQASAQATSVDDENPIAASEDTTVATEPELQVEKLQPEMRVLPLEDSADEQALEELEKLIRSNNRSAIGNSR